VVWEVPEVPMFSPQAETESNKAIKIDVNNNFFIFDSFEILVYVKAFTLYKTQNKSIFLQIF
jgi:hypothetical protein